MPVINRYSGSTMNIKEISISNNKKKQILAAISDEAVMFQDENGDVVVNTETYLQLKDETGKAPIEEILEVEALETMADYVVFQ